MNTTTSFCTGSYDFLNHWPSSLPPSPIQSEISDDDSMTIREFIEPDIKPADDEATPTEPLEDIPLPNVPKDAPEDAPKDVAQEAPEDAPKDPDHKDKETQVEPEPKKVDPKEEEKIYCCWRFTRPSPKS